MDNEQDDIADEMSEGSMDFFIPADDEHVAREKRKAAELRKSQWWKNELAKGKCHYCGGRFKPSELTMDHIVPIIRGGFTRKSNVVTCCKACNSRKKYLLPVEMNAGIGVAGRESNESTDNTKEDN
ncbi:MAG: HNH endonuclease [Victivallales bacterium]|nr:HNH endonuclease [Victivallales bacterium]